MAQRTTRERILDKAMSLFARSGYEGAGMESMAAAVGVRKASLYSHFTGKEEIFRACFERVLQEYTSFLDGLARTSDGMALREALVAILAGYAEFFSSNRMMKFWERAWLFPPAFMAAEIRKRSAAADMPFYARVEAIFLAKCGEGAPEKASAFLYALTGFAFNARYYAAPDIKSMADRLVNTLQGGLDPA